MKQEESINKSTDNPTMITVVFLVWVSFKNHESLTFSLPLSVICHTLTSLDKTLFAVLSHYGNTLQCCQAHLKDSTQLLQVKFSSCKKSQLLIWSAVFTQKSLPQELMWRHTQTSSSVSSSGESVWPELLLQSNIEQVQITPTLFTGLTTCQD